MSDQDKYMRAWQVNAPGEIQQHLELTERALRPAASQLKPDQVLVRVLSAAINPADYRLLALGIVTRATMSFPKTPGMDLCGEVSATGHDVTDVRAGDCVIGRLKPMFERSGSLCEYVVLERAGYAKLNLDLHHTDVDNNTMVDQAGGASTGALTAYQAIQPYVRPGAGDRVFINGGSGGTGTFGIQIAKLLGCHVTTTCSTAKVELCRSLGADEVIDYQTTATTPEALLALLCGSSSSSSSSNGGTDGKPALFSVAVDNVGQVDKLYAKSASFLLPGAPYVSVGGGSLGETVRNAATNLLPAFLGGGKVKIVNLMMVNRHEDLAQIAEWLVQGRLRTVVDSTFEFGEVPAAFARLQKGSCAGKVIIHVAAKS